MGNTYKHKILGKWKNGVITEVPLFIQKFWDRWNFSVDEAKETRIRKREKILNKEMKDNLFNR